MPRVKSTPRNDHRLERSQRSPHAMGCDSPYSDDDDDGHQLVTPFLTPLPVVEATTAVEAATVATTLTTLTKAALEHGDSDESEGVATAVAPPPPVAMVMESPPDAAILRERRRLSAAFAGMTNGVSPLEGDVKRKRTPRFPKKSETLEQLLTRTELSEKRVIELIETLYEEQEQDDREMYNLSMQTVREETKCDMSNVVEELNATDFRRLLTYGEVSAESISQTVLPLLNLQADDVFYDLGCGTGKIVVQVALQTPCMVAKGIELMQNRVTEGTRALDRLDDMKLPVLNDKDIQIVQGDILKPPQSAPLTDATVAFINNVCFTPELMLKVLDVLSHLPKLRQIVTLRKICERHRPRKCAHAGNYCVEYVQPPEEAEINVSWADKTSVYRYERIEFSITKLTKEMAGPPSSS